MLVKYRVKKMGFTMIELLIVIVILGLMASLVAPKFFAQLGTAERGIAATQMSAFETALDTYRLDMGRYPEKLEYLLSEESPKWNGPYLPKAIPMDPWGNPYIYSRSDNRVEPYNLKSYGADGKEGGTEGDEDVLHR